DVAAYRNWAEKNPSSFMKHLVKLSRKEEEGKRRERKAGTADSGHLHAGVTSAATNGISGSVSANPVSIGLTAPSNATASGGNDIAPAPALSVVKTDTYRVIMKSWVTWRENSIYSALIAFARMDSRRASRLLRSPQGVVEEGQGVVRDGLTKKD